MRFSPVVDWLRRIDGFERLCDASMRALLAVRHSIELVEPMCCALRASVISGLSPEMSDSAKIRVNIIDLNEKPILNFHEYFNKSTYFIVLFLSKQSNRLGNS